MSPTRFTGERLHEGDALFAVDLARHRAAYEFAAARLAGRRVLDLGSGGGRGAARLAVRAAAVLAIDRIAPDPESRAGRTCFCRADIAALPLRPHRFDAVTSFQVIEHLADPEPYLRAIGTLLAPGGCALLSTPNRRLSSGANPYHVREYLSDELGALLAEHFAQVELLGVGMSEAARRYTEALSRRVQRLLRLDPLGLRERLPRAWLTRGFVAAARWVRWRTFRAAGGSEITWRDYPIGPADDATSLDWIAVCRDARS